MSLVCESLFMSKSRWNLLGYSYSSKQRENITEPNLLRPAQHGLTHAQR